MFMKASDLPVETPRLGVREGGEVASDWQQAQGNGRGAADGDLAAQVVFDLNELFPCARLVERYLAHP